MAKKKITAGMLGVKKKQVIDIEKAVSEIHDQEAKKVDPVSNNTIPKPKTKKPVSKTRKPVPKIKKSDQGEIVRVSFNLTKQLHKKLKIKALMNEISIQDLMTELTEKFVREK